MLYLLLIRGDKMHTVTLSQEQYFLLHDGRALRDLRELHEALKNMSPELFSFHVNEERNDFTNWIRGVFHDEILADEVYRAKTQDKVLAVLNKKLNPPQKKKAFVVHKAQNTNHAIHVEHSIDDVKEFVPEHESRQEVINKLKGAFS